VVELFSCGGNFSPPLKGKLNRMKKLIISIFFLLTLLALNSNSQPKPGILKSTSYRTEKYEFSMGGTIVLTGAPDGSIAIEGWQKNEVLIEAEIELNAPTESDLAKLSALTGFVVDKDYNSMRIISVGTHDKDYLKRVAKKLPKHLIGLPFKINYKLKLPIYSDVEVNGGRGDFTFSGIDGNVSIQFLEANKAKLNVSGGTINASFGSGDIEVNLLTSSWRGRFLNVGLGKGTMQINLPANTNAELDISILQEGKIENGLIIKPREREEVNDKRINARIGNGGATLSFKVISGTVRISELPQ
jgi:hypothetical protein